MLNAKLMEDHKHTAEQACLAEGLARRRPCSYRAGWSEAVGKTLELGQGTGQTVTAVTIP